MKTQIPVRESKAAVSRANDADFSKPRMDSVDVLRGLVMVIMALDHVRIYFTNIGFAPEDMQQTYLTLFLTRWITHFCAPVFFLLAGAGAYLSLQAGKSIGEVSRFLWKRGLWLILLELTLIGFSWSFIPGFSFGGVIWALGWSMIILSLVIRVPLIWTAAIGIGMMLFHHLLDGIAPSDLGALSWLWTILHANGIINIAPPGMKFFILYPLVPSVGVMATGFALGSILTRPVKKRKTWLAAVGWGAIAAFAFLRLTNLYGFDAQRAVLFQTYDSLQMTIISFLNTQKYPFSLQFLLMTLGPSLIFLAWYDGKVFGKLSAWFWNKILLFGRVPMFFYLQHILLIHLLAVLVAILWQQPVQGLIAKPLPFAKTPEGYGHGLVFVYAMTVLVNVILYFSCRWFAGLKKRRNNWWLRYL